MHKSETGNGVYQLYPTSTGVNTPVKKENVASILMRQRPDLESELRELSKEELIAECIENTERKEMADYFLMETNQHSAFVAYSTKIEKEGLVWTL